MRNPARILTYILLFTIVYSCDNSSKNGKIESNKKSSTSDTSTNINNDLLNESLRYENQTTGQIATMTFNSEGTAIYYPSDDTSSFRAHHSGLEYKFIKRGNGNYFPQAGDVIYINMIYKTEQDSIIFNSNDFEGEFKIRVSEPSHNGGSIEDAFSIMKEGDSAMFKIDAKDFLLHTKKVAKLPTYIKESEKLSFYIKMNRIEKASDFISLNSETYNYYIEQENSLIKRFLLNYDYPIEKTKSGLRILKISEGKGKKPNLGEMVSIHYTLGFIDGGVFDSTLEREQAFKFKLGSNQVIPGLEESVLRMNIGDHNISIIPFRLAYGDQRHGVIAPFSTLVFEIELLDAR